MNWELFGIAVLCASQGGMWISRGFAMRDAKRDTKRHFDAIDAARNSVDLFQKESFEELERSTAAVDRCLNGLPNRSDFGNLRDEIRAALDRLPKKRNTRKVKPAPSPVPADPVGPVST